MFKANLPPSLEKLEDCFNQNEVKDRFIQSRNDILNMETEIQIKSKEKLYSNEETDRDENAIFRSILEINLNNVHRQRKQYSMIPFSFDQEKLKLPEMSRFKERFVSKQPFKVLDAPNLLDDYYVNIIDWSHSNTIAVGLGNSCYLWNFNTNHVEKVSEFDENNTLTSVTWDMKSDHLALGTLDGKVEIYDAEKKKLIKGYDDHKERVGAISYYGNFLLTGSRDKKIIMRDIRVHKKPVMIFDIHKQEVCGIKWSPDGLYFASGGNDNALYIFSPKTIFPLMKKNHKAAVRAISWSERQYGILATGSGTADRCIRLWNLHERKLIDIRDTESQICNIVFSKKDDEIITSHGFSNNDICIWKTKGLRKTHSLFGHTHRVLHLAISPCGNYIVSGAGDETLRFWNLNYAQNNEKCDKREFNLNSLQVNTLR